MLVALGMLWREPGPALSPSYFLTQPQFCCLLGTETVRAQQLLCSPALCSTSSLVS